MGAKLTGPTPNVFDGVAGAELQCLEAWVINWFQQYGKGIFKTIEPWRGQFKIDGLKRESFKTPALFIACVGTSGASETKGSKTIANIRFSAVLVTENGNKAKLGGKVDRYKEAVAKASVMWRMLHVLVPGTDKDWARANGIQFKNNYTEKLDKQGIAMFDFTWTHKLSIGDINLDDLADLLTIAGEIFPDDPTHTTLPVEGEVTFEP